ncbi:GTPase HflX [Lachnoanaerobaculum umeaense]|jgi:GTP-binding protein hflX|uniref:GTPase HflX n=1 Tax=Lachnoanaerobaculum umeaense TaxID=617123 RepID=A0A385Q3Y6_9FIRM|nr:GTPase HflX [Lachnoanaerobaculum umeaense]AYB00505.1 GTPase HflX [Lachnoanaerobaculum umeaense]PZW98561.1 GTP-binding protein HflX [Lachnoanaerobaculum umeaense]
MSTFETKEIVERVILLGVDVGDDTKESMKELAELVDTAGAVVLDSIIQSRERMHPGTYIGKGKIEEVKERVLELDATGVVCDDELTPAQLRNLENLLDTKVMDRTMVILDIFAKRATTSEGKIQVELAQLKFSSARLIGLRSSLSRLGGGIGTRGPGEKKLEMDRRLIHERISQLKSELKKVENHRELIRKSRDENLAFNVAIVGYTNAGKSTLLNKLTDADILAEDKLFATLDPTTRKLKLGSGQEILMTDTVGFIRKLPHHLIEAFKSTLEEAKYANLLIHMVDASNEEATSQMLVVYDTLRSLEVVDKDIITIFNKTDLMEEDMELPRDFHADKVLKMSAKTGEGIEELKKTIEDILQKQRVYLEHIFSYKEAGKIAIIRKFGEILSEEYIDEGISIKAYIPAEIFGKVK